MLGPDNTNYEINALAGGLFAVRITRANGLPAVVDGFTSAEDAQNWIDERLIEAAAPDPVPPGPFHTFKNR